MAPRKKKTVKKDEDNRYYNISLKDPMYWDCSSSTLLSDGDQTTTKQARRPQPKSLQQVASKLVKKFRAACPEVEQRTVGNSESPNAAVDIINLDKKQKRVRRGRKKTKNITLDNSAINRKLANQLKQRAQNTLNSRRKIINSRLRKKTNRKLTNRNKNNSIIEKFEVITINLESEAISGDEDCTIIEQIPTHPAAGKDGVAKAVKEEILISSSEDEDSNDVTIKNQNSLVPKPPKWIDKITNVQQEQQQHFYIDCNTGYRHVSQAKVNYDQNVINTYGNPSENNDDTLIILDDSTEIPPTPNESVICLDDSDFIRLPDVPKNSKRKTTTANDTITLRNRFSNDLFTKSEIKQLANYNNNTYNPDAGLQPLSKKRIVIIDGSNVAIQHSRKGEFSVKGLQICIKYFKMMGHDVKAVLPLFRKNRNKSTDPEALDRLHQDGIVCFTPCKNIPGLFSQSYDDRFILQLACELDGAVVSNDNYRDLLHENRAFKKIIENRVIGYTWCGDIFIVPKDPYGRLGPQLHTILNRT